MKKLCLLFGCVFSILVIHAQSPICTYLFDGNGLDAADTNHLLLNNVTYTTDMEGVNNKAASFNGTNSWAKMPNIIPNPMSEFRLSLWFKTKDNQVGGGLAWGGTDLIGTFVTNYTPLLYIDTFGKLNTFLYDCTVTPIKSSAAVNDDLWHHAMVTFTINPMTGVFTQNLYLDGVNVASKFAAVCGTPMYNNVYIGACNARGIGDVPEDWMYFNGSIDEVNIFTQVLSYPTWSNLMFKLSNLPTSKTVDEGYTGSFTHITNTNYLSEQMIYTWKNGTSIIKSDTVLAATSDSIDLGATVLSQTGNYTCEVTNAYGKTLISQIAVLTVNDTSSSGTGVHDVSNINQFFLYPNPVYDVIYLNNLPDQATITLYAVDGQIVKSLEIGDYNNWINVSELQKGVYILNVRSSEGIWSSKFTKE